MKSCFASLVHVSNVRPFWARAIRAALVWFVFVAIGIAMGEVLFGFQAGFVGWVVCFTDDATISGRRFAGAVVVTFVGALVTVIGSIAGNTVVGSVVATAGIGFCAVLFAIAGPNGQKKGLVTMFLTIFAIGFPTSVDDAIGLGVASIVGGGGAMLLMLAWLPFERGRSKSAIAARLFDSAANLVGLYAQEQSDTTIIEARTSITGVIQDVFSDAGYIIGGGGRDWLIERIELATNILRAASAFTDVRAITSRPHTEEIREMYGAVGQVCSAEADRIRSGGSEPVDLARAVQAFSAVSAQIRDDSAIATGGGALLDLRRSVVALDIDNRQTATPDAPETRIARVRFGRGPLSLVYINLRYDTILRRHLLRYLALIVVSTLLYKLLDIPDGFFIPMGINIMLQPDLGTGFTRLQIFSVGTVIGSVIGAVIGVALGSMPIAIAAITAGTLFCMTAFVLKTYWSFAIGISMFIIAGLGLLIQGGWGLAGWRIANTLIAAAFVGTGLIALWPSRGKALVPRECALVLNQLAKRLTDVVGRASPADVEAQRRRVVAHEGQLGLRVEQYSKEPGHSQAKLDQFRSIVIQIKQIDSAIADLNTTLNAEQLSLSEPTRDLSERVATTIRRAATALEHSSPAADLPRLVASDAPRPLPPIDAELTCIGVGAQSLCAYLPDKAGGASQGSD